MHEESVKREVLDVLESLCGVADASMVDTVSLVFDFLHPLLRDCVALLGKCWVKVKTRPQWSSAALRLYMRNLSSRCAQWTKLASLFLT